MSKHIKYGLFQGKNLYRLPKPSGKIKSVKPNILTIFDCNDLENDVYDLVHKINQFNESSWLDSKEKRESFNSLTIKELNYKTNTVRKIKISKLQKIVYDYVMNDKNDINFINLIYNSIFDLNNRDSYSIISFSGKISEFKKFLKQSSIKHDIVINSKYDKSLNKTYAVIDNIDDDIEFLLNLNYNDFKLNKTTQN